MLLLAAVILGSLVFPVADRWPQIREALERWRGRGGEPPAAGGAAA